MRARLLRLTDPRGIALPLVLMVLMLLSTLVLALLSMSSFEPLISKNLVTAEQARFVAEAGIEWAFNTVAASSDWDAFLAGSDSVRGAVLIADAPIPGQPASDGTYTVWVRNDNLVADRRLTGEPADAGGPTHDTNRVVIVTSAGRVGHASRVLQVVLQRIELPPIPAALAFPGNTAPVRVSGGAEIDGTDGTPDGTAGSCAPVFGISVSSVLPASASGTNEAVVEGALAGHPAASVRGKKQDPAGSAFGANTIAPDDTLTSSGVDSFVSAVRNADVVLESGEPGGRSFADIGAVCASDWSSFACWGTRDRPKVVSLKGNPDLSPAAPTFQISGSAEGHGILIVEGGELRISGTLRWHGLIIVTGNRAALDFLGGENQTVYGAIIVNAASSDAGAGRVVLNGDAKLRYSCQALDQARRARKLVTMRSWREVE